MSVHTSHANIDPEMTVEEHLADAHRVTLTGRSGTRVHEALHAFDALTWETRVVPVIEADEDGPVQASVQWRRLVGPWEPVAGDTDGPTAVSGENRRGQ